MLAKTETQEAKQIGKAKLLRLVKMKASAKKQASEINGTVGEQIKESIKSDNLRPWAFRTACALKAMPLEKLYHELPALLAYIDDLGLEEDAMKAAPLPLEPEAPPAEEA